MSMERKEGVPPVASPARTPKSARPEVAPSAAVDHRARAIAFHRRAQAAEGAAAKATDELRYWRAAFAAMARNKGTLKRRLNRARARLRAARLSDPLTRIIELGRLFP